MFIHNIFIANSFKKGDRFAYDIVIPAEEMSDELNESEILRSFLVTVYDALGGDTTITTHVIPTESKDWDSVVKRDTFFSDIKIIKSEKNFIKNLSYNINLSYYDIVYLVISIIKDRKLKDYNIDEFVEKIGKEYYEKYNENLYEKKQTNRTNRMPLKAIYKYSNIIVDRVLSAKNGFEKYKFVLDKIREFV
nr:MAG TPA: hypothetical protein [Caudoviricetes sp.]